ncbi:MAG TPA: VacJ family lipoprotein [Ramlibacter sp.]
MTAASSFRGLRQLLLAVAACATLALAGCAVGPNPRDPLEPFNRGVSQFNEKVDAVVLKPSATFYREKVPPMARTGVSNFFSNLGDAWSGINSLLQLKIQNGAENLMRFSVNTFFGLGGILDPASEMNIERHREDFGQTLGRWGVPAGPYIVLPLLGPSTLRDTIALPVDWQGDPLYHVSPEGTRDSLYGLRLVDVRANLLRAGDVLEGAALDKYSFTRDAYLQKRRADVFEGTSRQDNPGGGAGGATDGSEGSDGYIEPEPDAAPAAGSQPGR